MGQSGRRVRHSLPTRPATRHGLWIITSPLTARECPRGKSLLSRARRGGYRCPACQNRNTLWSESAWEPNDRLLPGTSPIESSKPQERATGPRVITRPPWERSRETPQTRSLEFPTPERAAALPASGANCVVGGTASARHFTHRTVSARA